ncbi:MAG TPA: hypothetical protein VKZ85_16540 [Woeseiaceae bacterium]|nr:hypothetical protein [Woeseiaceae bacterium]
MKTPTGNTLLAAGVLAALSFPALSQQQQPQAPMSFFVTSVGIGDGGNWTSNSFGAAIVGHHDRLGGPSASWNAVHSTRSCSQEDLVATGGAGLFYCFAID